MHVFSLICFVGFNVLLSAHSLMEVIIHPKYIELALILNWKNKNHITGCADHPARWLPPNPSNKAIGHPESRQLSSLQPDRGEICFVWRFHERSDTAFPPPRTPSCKLSPPPLPPHASIDLGIRHMTIAPPGDVCDCSRFALICRRQKAQWVVALSLGWLITVPISAYVSAGERYLACWKPKKLKEIGRLLEALKTHYLSNYILLDIYLFFFLAGLHKATLFDFYLVKRVLDITVVW